MCKKTKSIGFHTVISYNHVSDNEKSLKKFTYHYIFYEYFHMRPDKKVLIKTLLNSNCIVIFI
jgi:hypothetical protein